MVESSKYLEAEIICEIYIYFVELDHCHSSYMLFSWNKLLKQNIN